MMRREVLPALLLVFQLTSPQGVTNNNGRQKSVIVQLFEWKFSDIAAECERFLGPAGYAAVQTSPVSEHLVLPDKGHPWWQRYQVISYKIVSRSGNEAEFASMVNRCRRAGVKVYVDVVFNHMTAIWGNVTGSGGSLAYTQDLFYPGVPYRPEHFHEVCEMKPSDYAFNATQIRNCELSGLHDLNHTHPEVQNHIVEYLNRLIKLGVGGFRVDAAKHMWPVDLKSIYSRLNNLSVANGYAPNTRPFIYQEVIDVGGEAIGKSEYTALARVTEFKFGSELSKSLRGQNQLKWFSTFGPSWGMVSSENAVTFIDNHDNQRGHAAGAVSVLTHKDEQLYQMAVAFMLAWPYGTPRVISSYRFSDPDQGPPMDTLGNIRTVAFDKAGDCNNGWVCEHRWRSVYKMVAFRNIVDGTNVTNWWDNGNNQISFCRGNRGFIAINNDKQILNETLQTCLTSGFYCNIFANSCQGNYVKVSSNGTAQIKIAPLSMLAIHVQSKV